MAWTWAAARDRGVSHIKNGSACQDIYACHAHQRGQVLAAIVCDGAGSAEFGKYGALLTARTMMECARQHFSRTNAMPDDDLLWTWVDDARERIVQVAERRDLERRAFATTMVACFATAHEIVIAHIGDGACVVKTEHEWRAMSWPESGEYASTTMFVTDSPAPKLRITRAKQRSHAIALFTDGIERLVLKFATQEAHGPFFDNRLSPLEAKSGSGRDAAHSQTLEAFLASNGVTQRTDDDKSLIIALCRP